MFFGGSFSSMRLTGKRAFLSLSVLFLLLVLAPKSSSGQHLQGKRIARGSFLEMRGYNHELGVYWGYGGYGGILQGEGPVLTSSAITVGYYPEKVGETTVSGFEGRPPLRVDRSFQGWGLDLKYQVKAFTSGKYDEGGLFIKWAPSFHLAFFDLSYEDPAEAHPDHQFFKHLEKDRTKAELYFEGALGYQFDLGAANLSLELQGGMPNFTVLARSFNIVLGGSTNAGSIVDIDQDHIPLGMPFFLGGKIGVAL